MDTVNICPKCGQLIDSSRLHDKVVICQSCGWMKPTKNAKIQKVRNFTSILMSGLVIVLILSGFMYYVRTWDAFALQALPLHIKHMTGIANTNDTLKMLEICESRKNLDCVLKYSQRLLDVDEHRLLALKTMGHNLYLHKDFNLAMVSLSDYEKEGGNDTTILFEYGKTLINAGELKESIRVFEKAIEQKPGVLQISVLQEYVKSLIKDGQFKKALQTIEYVQENATKTNKFMESEVENLKAKVGASNKSFKLGKVKSATQSVKQKNNVPGRIYKLPPKIFRKGT